MATTRGLAPSRRSDHQHFGSQRRQPLDRHCQRPGAAYRWHFRQVAARLDLQFEERLAERTRIAQDLHDTLLQGFLSASMQLHLAADEVPADSVAKPRLSRVLQLMGQVIEEGRNAVRGLRVPAPQTSGADDLGQALSRVPQELGLKEPGNFRVLVEGPPQPLRPLIRDEVYRVGREALVNAFRHSGAAEIEVEIEFAAGALRGAGRALPGGRPAPRTAITGEQPARKLERYQR